MSNKVKVVRCEKCKYYRKIGKAGVCIQDKFQSKVRYPDDYCNYGREIKNDKTETAGHT